MKRSRDGFTLVETVVVTAVLTILLGFLLTAFLSVGRTYRSVVEANLVQTKSLHAISFLKDSVKNSSGLQIVSVPPNVPEGYSAIWCEGDKLYYKNGDNSAEIYMQDTSFTVDFTSDGCKLGIKLGVLTDGKPYVLESAVALQNVSIISGAKGNAIQFKTVQDTTG